MRPKNHTPGQVRYLTYKLHFPKDKDVWTDQIPFAQPIDVFIKNTALYKKNLKACLKLMQTGEGHWKDNNGVTHQIMIEEIERPRVWGIKKALPNNPILIP